MQLKQVFQQPDAGNAMNSGNVERDTALYSVREIEQALLKRGFVEKGPLGLSGRTAHAHTGRFVQVVKMSQPAPGQQVVDDETAITAKSFSGLGERAVGTRFAAMKTGRVLTERAFAPRPC